MTFTMVEREQNYTDWKRGYRDAVIGFVQAPPECPSYKIGFALGRDSINHHLKTFSRLTEHSQLVRRAEELGPPTPELVGAMNAIGLISPDPDAPPPPGPSEPRHIACVDPINGKALCGVKLEFKESKGGAHSEYAEKGYRQWLDSFGDPDRPDITWCEACTAVVCATCRGSGPAYGPHGCPEPCWLRPPKEVEAAETTAVEHSLKTWPHEHDEVGDGRKTFEVRSNADRSFGVGDILLLRRWDPAANHNVTPGAYVNTDGALVAHADRAHTHRMRVIHILHGGRFGLPPGFCIMSIVFDKGAD